ncbi:MAG: hypothetical protein FWF29_13345, partial [Treponema sp.]|nr:hypothetical protein [Treponema sp.]
MKTASFFIILSLIVVLFGTCLNPWNGDESIWSGKGTLSIVWGNTTTARSAGFVQLQDLEGFEYEITLTGPGEKQTKIISNAVSETFTVIPGAWTITVKGYDNYLQNNVRELRVMGIEQLKVSAGANGAKKIHMYTANEAGSWAELNDLVAQNDSDSEAADREEIIVIKESFDFSITDNTIYIHRPLILIAESNVSIGRSESPQSSFVFPSFFSVYSPGTLTLGKPGMRGALTIDNKGENSESLVVVNGSNGSGKLIMNKGVTITGAHAVDGGGVYIGLGGIFTNNGGTISGNNPGVVYYEQIVPESFTVKLLVSELVDKDSVSFANGSSAMPHEIAAHADDEITIFYTLKDTDHNTDQLILSFINPEKNRTFSTKTETLSGTYTYRVDPEDAVDGEITISALFLHTNLLGISANDFVVTYNPATYDGSEHGATVAYRNGISETDAGNITVYYDGDEEIPVNAGSYLIAVTTGGGSVYAPVSSLTVGTLVIKSREITITPNADQTKVYNTDDPVLTYTPSEPLLPGNAYSGALARAVGTNTGLYAINLGTLKAEPNYTLVLSGTQVNFEIKQAPGPAVSQPAVSGTPTFNSITVGAVTLTPATSQTVQYAITASDSTAPVNGNGWSINRTFSNLSPGTTYNIWARAIANTNYGEGISEPGAISTAASPVIVVGSNGLDNLMVGQPVSGASITYTLSNGTYTANVSAG